jgi:purine-binding chemotaxis protein CheW
MSGGAADGRAPGPEIAAIEKAASEARAASGGALERLIAAMEEEAAWTPVDAGPAEAPGSEAAPEVCIVFGLGGARFALPIRQALEMDVEPAVAPVPFVPDWVRGVTNRRGEIVPVIDLRVLMGFEAAAPGRGRILVVPAGEPGEAAALVVDHVVGTASLERKCFQRAQGGGVADLLEGMGEHDGAALGLLDLERVLAAARHGGAAAAWEGR